MTTFSQLALLVQNMRHDLSGITSVTNPVRLSESDPPVQDEIGGV